MPVALLHKLLPAMQPIFNRIQLINLSPAILFFSFSLFPLFPVSLLTASPRQTLQLHLSTDSHTTYHTNADRVVLALLPLILDACRVCTTSTHTHKHRHHAYARDEKCTLAIENFSLSLSLLMYSRFCPCEGAFVDAMEDERWGMQTMFHPTYRSPLPPLLHSSCLLLPV